MADSSLGFDGLRHISVRSCREDVIGEVVFYSHWQALMQQPSGDPSYGRSVFQDLLDRTLGQPSQRDATVAASIVQWLGTNAGSSLLGIARDIQDGSSARGVLAHHLAWASVNRRIYYVNEGRRTLEFILLGEKAVPRDPAVSVRDAEIAECLAVWFDSADGARFLKACDAEIAVRRDAGRHYRSGVRTAA